MRFSRPSWPDRYVAAILALPVLVLWHCDNPLYTPLRFTDPWYYLGYFRTLLDFKRDLFPDAYFGSRLSWILPGFLVHRLFSPLPANFILHAGVHLLASLSFFAILRRIAGERAAFLSTLLFSLNPWLWAATGWDYVNGAGIAYMLCTMAWLTAAGGRDARKRLLLFAAGAGMAAMVYAHFLWLSLAPLLVLYYAGLAWTWRSERPLAAAWGSLPWLASGFASVTVVLGLVNYAVVGRFWFYGLSWNAAMRSSEVFTTAPAVWGAHGLEPWLWFPAMTAAVCAFLLARRPARRDWKQSLPAVLLVGQLLFALAWMGYLQARGIAMLGFYHYAAYLLPYAFLAAGAMLWNAVEAMSARGYLAVCAAAAMASAIVWYQPRPEWPLPAWVAAALCGAPLALGVTLRRRAAGTWLTLAGFLLLSSHAAGVTAGMHGTRAEYRRVMEAREQVERARNHDRVRFWFDGGEAGSDEYYALNSLYLDVRLGTHFPQDGCKTTVQPGTLIVIPSARQDAAGRALRELSDCWRAWAMKPVAVARYAVARPDRPYSIAMLRAVTDLAGQSALEAVQDGGTVKLRVAPELAACALPALWKKENPGTVLREGPDGIDVRTPSGDYDYAFAYPPLAVPIAGRYRFALRYTASSGEFAFGAFPADNSRWLATSTVGYREGGAREISFSVDLGAGEAVVLRVANNNNRRDGTPAAFKLLQLTATVADPR